MSERELGCICELDNEGQPIVSQYQECPIHKPDAPDPKSTANQLVNKYYSLRAYETMSLEGKRIAYGLAKESAVIAIDEILNVLDTFQRHEYAKILIAFYQSVKKEIELQ